MAGITKNYIHLSTFKSKNISDMKIRQILFVGCLLWIFAVIRITAQKRELQPLPVDPEVRYGQLDNGLTYYIRHNARPKDRADFFIAQKVGSMQEEENQRGLAHFLEHMAFDGTLHFPGHAMDEFTQSIGMRGGENFNAYTGFDETVYMIMGAPVVREGIVDSCLLILHDWSGFITLADTAIERERAIIREEWRTSQDAQARIWKQQLPKLLPGNSYADRAPIGSLDVIDRFKPEELRAYYKKWYRPDLQGIIIVGDIDPDRVEAAVKRIFADIPAPVHPAKREYAVVKDNRQPLVSISKDREETDILLSIFYKHDKLPAALYATSAGLADDYMKFVVRLIMGERLSGIAQQATPPFITAQVSDGNYLISKTKDAFTVSALVKGYGIKEALDALVVEMMRLKRHGFTRSEYDRARNTILKQYESLYKDRDHLDNGAYANEYLRHFTEGGYIPGLAAEYELIRQMASQIPLEDVNQYARNLITNTNIAISLTGPDRSDIPYPSEAELAHDFKRACRLPAPPYEDRTSDEPLVSDLPALGVIREERTDSLFGTTRLTLGNGVRVVLKQTDFQPNEILMTATSPGGSTLFGAEDVYNLKIFNDAVTLGGVGRFPNTELDKILSGIEVSCSPSIGLNTENINGYASPADLKTLFQLVYLYFTAPRTDEEAYASFENRMVAQLENLDVNPMVAFSDTLTNAIYGGNPRSARLLADDFRRISYPRIMEMYRERFADASDFLFTFVGNIDMDSIRPYIRQYLATLPSTGRIEKADPSRVPSVRKGVYTNRFRRAQETPKASVADFWSGKMKYDLENLLTASLLEQILDLAYMEKIREEEGGSYGVQTSLSLSSFPEGETSLQVYFDTDPAKREKMNAIVLAELERIARSGPDEGFLKKSRDNILKRYAESRQENIYWLTTLNNYYFRGFDGETTFAETLAGITPARIRTFVKELLEQGNRIEVVMEP